MVAIGNALPTHRNRYLAVVLTSYGAKYTLCRKPISATRAIAAAKGRAERASFLSAFATASKNVRCNCVDMPSTRPGSEDLLYKACREFGGRITADPVSQRNQSSFPSTMRKKSICPVRM